MITACHYQTIAI